MGLFTGSIGCSSGGGCLESWPIRHSHGYGISLPIWGVKAAQKASCVSLIGMTSNVEELAFSHRPVWTPARPHV